MKYTGDLSLEALKDYCKDNNTDIAIICKGKEDIKNVLSFHNPLNLPLSLEDEAIYIDGTHSSLAYAKENYAYIYAWEFCMANSLIIHYEIY